MQFPPSTLDYFKDQFLKNICNFTDNVGDLVWCKSNDKSVEGMPTYVVSLFGNREWSFDSSNYFMYNSREPLMSQNIYAHFGLSVLSMLKDNSPVDDYQHFILGQLFVTKYKVSFFYNFFVKGGQETIELMLFIKSDTMKVEQPFSAMVGWVFFFVAIIQFILRTYKMKLERLAYEKKLIMNSLNVKNESEYQVMRRKLDKMEEQ